MNKTASFYYPFIAVLLMIFNIVLYIYVYLNDLQTLGFRIFANLNALIWGLIACVIFLLVAIEFSTKTSPGKIWLLLMLGFLFWWGGDLMWAIYEVILQEEELFPSPADYVYLVGYLFMYGALLFQLRSFPAPITKKEKSIIISIVLAIFIIVLVILIIPIVQTPIDDEFTTLQLFFSLFYPLADLVLLGIVLPLLFKLQGGQFVRPWRILTIGFLAYVTVDFLFTWIEWQGFPNGSLIYDNLYVGCSMLLAGGALVMRDLLRKKDI